MHRQPTKFSYFQTTVPFRHTSMGLAALLGHPQWREDALPRQIAWIGHTSEMGRHELLRVQHAHDGGLVLFMVARAFDPSLGVGR